MGRPVGLNPTNDPAPPTSYAESLPNRTDGHSPVSEQRTFEYDDRVTPEKLPADPAFHQPDEDASPADSLSSNHISIESLRDDDDSSSLADSESDFEGCPPKVPAFIVDAMRNGAASIPQATNNGVIVIKNGVSSGGRSNILAGASSNGRPNIGSIALQNSSDITFGDKTFYQGPVTVKQFFLEKEQWRNMDSADGPMASGCENGGFVPSDDQNRKEAQDLSGQPKTREKLSRWQKLMELERSPLMMTIIVAAGIVVLGLLGTVLYLVLKSHNEPYEDHAGDGDDNRLNIPVESSIEAFRNALDRWIYAQLYLEHFLGMDIITGYTTPFRFIARQQWLAQPPNTKLAPLEGTAYRVIIAHTATTSCVTQAECVFQVRTIQTFHMESLGWDDIGYNFLVGGDGAAYEGRGWDTKGAHTLGFNDGSICISFIGTFTQTVPVERQIQVALLLIEDGLRKKKLTPDYKLYGHRQFIGTESPGRELYEIVKTWPHWTNKLEIYEQNTTILASTSSLPTNNATAVKLPSGDPQNHTLSTHDDDAVSAKAKYENSSANSLD